MSTSFHPALRHLGVAVAVVMGVIAVVWGALALINVHDDASELGWLREQAPTGSYRVIELGEVGSDGYAEAVWVDVPGQPNAFIDLSRSSEQVRAVGDRVQARVDEREAPALGDGLPADVVSSGVGFRYVGPVTLVAVGLLLVGSGVVAGGSSDVGRRQREPVDRHAGLGTAVNDAR
ncbi:MAG: hypothetical protein L0H96_15240 [Humibacillus sp.]|nr:hypothetical protein [Humibacillus sp.]MDN5778256.1 hypothetical protein [Humibacillus sp.]